MAHKSTTTEPFCNEKATTSKSQIRKKNNSEVRKISILRLRNVCKVKCARIHGKKTTIEKLAGKTTTTIIMNLFTLKTLMRQVSGT